jgi:hypothetical protein
MVSKAVQPYLPRSRGRGQLISAWMHAETILAEPSVGEEGLGLLIKRSPSSFHPTCVVPFAASFLHPAEPSFKSLVRVHAYLHQASRK